MNAEAQLVATHYMDSVGFGGFAVHRYGVSRGPAGMAPENNNELFPPPTVPALSSPVLSAAALVLLSLGLVAALRARS